MRTKSSALRRLLQLLSGIFGVNVVYFFSRSLVSSHPNYGKSSLRHGFHFLEARQKSNLFSDSQIVGNSFTSEQDRSNHLILVAGHAVVKIDQIRNALLYDKAWHLLSYQLNQDFPKIIASHIQKGIELALEDTNSTLIFSGGETRRDVGPLSEAASYYYVAMENEWMKPDFVNRVYLEEFARDSFENLLFSICRFKEVNGVYPNKISVIGFDFKARRFSDLHRLALRLPLDAFNYYGIRPPSHFDYKRAVIGEREAYKQFLQDIYACHTTPLRIKREKRNPFLRTVPYELSNPALVGLLEWCGPEIYSGELPWSIGSDAEEKEYAGLLDQTQEEEEEKREES